MKTFKENDFVRLLDEPKNSINAMARIAAIYEDGSVWIVNYNMPFCGTISEILTKEEAQKTLEVVEE